MAQHKLVICEKPSQAQAIAAVLGAKERKDGCIVGNGWIVSWCVGHLVELASAAAYDERFAKWVYDDLPILPESWKFVVSSGKKKQLDILRKLMNDKDTESIICATDAGREGQLIFQLVYNYCKCKKDGGRLPPVQRLWISSMEDSAIREGFEKLRPGSDYDNLYRAALCRSQADWLVGINATRVFSTIYGATLNVGRVQTPTLALITRREEAIAVFVEEAFYTPQIDTGTFTVSGERVTLIDDAETVRAACDGKTAIVRSVDRQEKTTAPPKLYDLTTLQREANRLYGFTAQQTLDYTQSLYEKKLCTYPRTDSRFLTSDMASGLPALVNTVAAVFHYGGDNPAYDAMQVINDSKVSDHHGIIPTPSIATADLSALPSGERDVLGLIAVRLLCSVSETHRYSTVSVVLDCEGRSFTAKGKTVLHNGWRSIEDLFRSALKNKPEDDSAEDAALPELAEGDTFASVIASVKDGHTSSPKRYTEDSLLSAMETAGAEGMPEDAERKGLGTPATRAGVIEKLVKSGFIERKKKQLHPTGKGINLIKVLPNTVKSAKLTAEWEHRLGEIECGTLTDSVFMEDIAGMTRDLVRDHSEPIDEYKTLFATAVPVGKSIGNCPRCTSAVTESQKGFFCSNRACAFALWKDNRFFAAKKKTITKPIATALLKEGRIFMSGLHSSKTGKTYDATIVLDDTGGKYVNFKLEFGQHGKGSNDS